MPQIRGPGLYAKSYFLVDCFRRDSFKTMLPSSEKSRQFCFNLHTAFAKPVLSLHLCLITCWQVFQFAGDTCCSPAVLGSRAVLKEGWLLPLRAARILVGRGWPSCVTHTHLTWYRSKREANQRVAAARWLEAKVPVLQTDSGTSNRIPPTPALPSS